VLPRQASAPPILSNGRLHRGEDEEEPPPLLPRRLYNASLPSSKYQRPPIKPPPTVASNYGAMLLSQSMASNSDMMMTMSDQALSLAGSPSLPFLFPKSLQKLQEYKNFKICTTGIGSSGASGSAASPRLREIMADMHFEAEQSVIDAGKKERYDYSCDMLKKYSWLSGELKRQDKLREELGKEKNTSWVCGCGLREEERKEAVLLANIAQTTAEVERWSSKKEKVSGKFEAMSETLKEWTAQRNETRHARHVARRKADELQATIDYNQEKLDSFQQVVVSGSNMNMNVVYGKCELN
jgi:hypothetical protein